MVASPLLQTATGGSPTIVALTFLALLLTAALSLLVAYLVVRRYSQDRNRVRLFFAVGLLLLTTGPIVLQFVLSNFTAVSATVRSGVANASKLVGLAAMLFAIYGFSPSRTRSSRRGRGQQDQDHSDEVEQ